MSRPKLTDEERAARKEENRERARLERERKKEERRAAGRARVDAAREDDIVEGGETSRDDRADGAHGTSPALARWRRPIFQVRGKNIMVSEEEKIAYLTEYARSGQAMHSAYVVGRAYETFRQLRKDDPVFEEQYKLAAQYFNESLSAEIVRRGRDGVLKPVFSPALGCEIGVERQYSDRMLEVEAKRRMPTEYRENVSFDVNDQRPHVLVITPPAATMEDWFARRDAYLEKKNQEQQRLLAGPSKAPVAVAG